MYLFKGEGRVQEQPALTVFHTVFHREHNRVAQILSRLNPRWSDEQIFQETRRFVIAEYQHIVYEEWLPIILGKFYECFYLVKEENVNVLLERNIVDVL